MYHIRNQVEAEIEIRKSRFIAIVTPINSLDDTGSILSAIKKKYPNASHYCTALRFHDVSRSSDDGEPSSTAGLPILECLRGRQLDQVYAVVVRYFGGTLLGTGGLVRTYQQATISALDKAVKCLPVQMGIYALTFPYEMTSRVETLLQNRAEILERQYDEQATIIYSCEDDLQQELREISNGRLEAVKTGEVIKEKPI